MTKINSLVFSVSSVPLWFKALSRLRSGDAFRGRQLAGFEVGEQRLNHFRGNGPGFGAAGAPTMLPSRSTTGPPQSVGRTTESCVRMVG